MNGILETIPVTMQILVVRRRSPWIFQSSKGEPAQENVPWSRGKPTGQCSHRKCVIELEFVLRFIMNLTKILGTSQTDMTLIPWWMVFAVYQSSPMLSISTGLLQNLKDRAEIDGPDLIYGPEHVTCKSYYITWNSCSFFISTITSPIPFSVIWSVRHAQQQSWNGASNLARSKLMPLFRTGTPWLLLSQPGVAPEKSKAEKHNGVNSS